MSNNQHRSPLPLLLALLLVAFLLYFYGEKWLRAVLLYLSRAGWARQLVTGFPPAWYVASRFVAGETTDDALAATRILNNKRMEVTLDFLGESVGDPTEARAARDEILHLLDAINGREEKATVSVKLSQLGMNIEPDLAYDNMRMILERAKAYGNFVRIDMEESAVVDTTFAIFERLRAAGFDNTGVVIQAYLYRSEADIRRLIDEGVSVRLCKGAYMEPPDVAFPDKEDVDDNFVRLTRLLLGEEARNQELWVAIATHDEDMIQTTIDYANQNHLPPSTFEFQMLYGVRRELQEALVDQGYRVRIYVPYGTAWYPYFMRRLAERPANLWFFITNFFRR